MEKKKRLFNLIKDDYLEIIICIIFFLWTISPIIEFIFKKYFINRYTTYYSSIIYVIGGLGIIIYLFYIIRYYKKENYCKKDFIPEILLLVLLCISIISTLLSKEPDLSLYGDEYRKEGLIVYIMYIGFILLASIIKDKKYMKYIVVSILINCLIITILPLFRSDFTFFRYSNVFRNFNHYGYYLMINTMLSLFMFIYSDKLFKKIIYMFIYIFILFLLIRNDTFGSYLAIMVTLAFLFIYSLVRNYQRKRVIVAILIFIITSFLVSHYDIKIGEKIHLESQKGIILKNLRSLNKDIKGYINNDEEVIQQAGTNRGILWQIAGDYILEHPIFGGGMECLLPRYNNTIYHKMATGRPHNSILQVAAFIGIPGAIIYLAFIMYVALSNLIIMQKDTMNIMIFCTAMCYFISSMFGNSMYYTSPYFMILLGLLIGFNRNRKNIKKNT